MFKKRFLAVLFAAIFVLQTLCMVAAAKEYTHDDLFKLSAKDFYTTFAKAVAGHDNKTVGKFIPCSDSTPFKYSGVVFSSYSVEILDKTRLKSEKNNKAAKITFNVKESSSALFPVGKQEYYVYIDSKGLCKFYPYAKKEKSVSSGYKELFDTSVNAAVNLFDFEDVSLSDLEDLEFTRKFVHYFYHTYLESDPKYRDGVKEPELMRELKIFCNTERKPNRTLMSAFKKKDNYYFSTCNHKEFSAAAKCNKITTSKKAGTVTLDIWFYSDAAKMNVCRKVKMTYKYTGGKYYLQKSDTYYENKYDVYIS